MKHVFPSNLRGSKSVIDFYIPWCVKLLESVNSAWFMMNGTFNMFYKGTLVCIVRECVSSLDDVVLGPDKGRAWRIGAGVVEGSWATISDVAKVDPSLGNNFICFFLVGALVVALRFCLFYTSPLEEIKSVRLNTTNTNKSIFCYQCNDETKRKENYNCGRAELNNSLVSSDGSLLNSVPVPPILLRDSTIH